MKAAPRSATLTDAVHAFSMQLFYDGPELTGHVSLDPQWLQLTDALKQLVPPDLAFRVLPDRRAVVVALPWRMQAAVERARRIPRVPAGLVGQEFFLDEKLNPARVVEFLESQYPTMTFTTEPTMKGFYAYGSILDMRSLVADVESGPRSRPSRRAFHQPKYDAPLLKTLLQTLVPDVSIEVVPELNLLIFEGEPAAIDQVEALLSCL